MLHRALLASTAPTGAMLLLGDPTSGRFVEPEGLALDFTSTSGRGTVAVRDATTPANNRSNAPIDDFLTNAGTSPKLVRQVDGTYAWAPHNQCLQSEDLGTSWGFVAGGTTAFDTNAAVAPNGTLTADRIKDTVAGGTGAVGAALAFTSVASSLLCFSAYVKADGLSWAQFQITSLGAVAISAYFNLATGAVGATLGANNLAQGVESVGNGWYRCWIAGQADASDTSGFQIIRAADADNDTTVDIDGTSSIFVWGMQTNRGLTPTRYVRTTTAAVYSVPFEYDSGWYGLIEPAATNLVLWSQEFDNAAWTKADTTITPNNTAAPDGLVRADLATEGAAGSSHVKQGVTISANATTSWSVFVKASANVTWLRFILFETANSANAVSGWINLLTGAVGSVANGGTGTGAAVTSVANANGFYRVTLSGAVNNSATAITAQVSSASADATTTRANNAAYFLWQAQGEAGAVATSPIPTFGATVTRARDSLEAALTAIPSVATVCSAYVDFVSMALGGGSILGFSETSATDDDERLYLGSTNLMRLRAVDEAGSQADIDSTVVATAGVRSQMAGRWIVNDFAISANGGAVVKDTSGTKAGEQTFLKFGKMGSSSNLIVAPVRLRRAVVVPRAVSDADMPTWRYAT